MLKSAMDTFDFQKIKNLEKKKQILSNWKKTIESHALNGVGEISIHGDFIIDIFSTVLGYRRIIENQREWNIVSEKKTLTDASKPDGTLGFFTPDSEDIRVVIELKSAAADLDAKYHRQTGKQSAVEQAFGYVHKSGKKCNWVIVSNYIELRLYHESSSGEYEYFEIASLTEQEEFNRFYYLLSAENLISKERPSVIEDLYKRNEADEENISKEFYTIYKQVRVNLFKSLKKNNSEKNELILLEKSQKILDRFIFVCFCEDTGLLPEKVFRKIMRIAKESFSLEENKIWKELKGLFRAIDKGLASHGINAFNGSLFVEDPILDSLIISDEIFEELAEITDYDFQSDLNVNILGHILEQSISDLEELRAEIKGEETDRKKEKRKKEGIYYTPEYITKYIVENAVSRWLEDRKKELGIDELPELTNDDYLSIKATKKGLKFNKKIEAHIAFWEAYKEKLMNIKVLDPACGSGAFLNQAFDFLYREGQKVNKKLSKLRGGQRDIFDLDKYILQSNLYGVDLNKEPVEITKLSLWLKTANKYSRLTDLDDNIKCGNSLIDNPEIAGPKAFKWEEEFPGIMRLGGFDVVIGNPPYGASLTFEEKELFKKIYSNVHSRMPDTFNYFISRSLSILKQDGYISFIVPNNLLYQNEYQKARNLLLGDNKIISVLNLGDKIFEESYVPTCIFLVKKKIEVEYSFDYGDLRYDDRKKTQFILKSSMNPFYKSEILKVPSFVFGINRGEFEILEKIEKLSHKIVDITQEVANGIQPTGDKIFRIDYDFAKKNHFEEEILKKVIVGGDFNRYELIDPGKYVIYTTKNLNIKDFPQIKSYLETFKEVLSKKRETMKGILPWWCLHWPRYPELFEEPKIVLRQTSDTIIATFDKSGFYAMNNVIILKLKPELDLDYKFVLACLNSKLINFMYMRITQEGSRTFAEVKPKNVKKLFIPKIPGANQLPFIEKVDKMLDQKKQLHDMGYKFNNFIAAAYNLNKVTNRLKNFYNLTFVEFINELKHQKSILTKKDEFELMELFGGQKEKVLVLKKEIDEIDKEIDQMVYELYGLTEEEIKVIEDA
jgi:type I restriction-modification system DNA methylase subunit